MIIARKIDLTKDFDKVKSILDTEEIEIILKTNQIIYVLEENNDIIGACQAAVHDKYAVLDYLIIKNDYRNKGYGDGLLRSILNYLLNNEVQKVYYPYINNYLIKIGFKIINNKNEIKHEIKNEFKDEFLECNLGAFFSKNCKSSRRWDID